MPGYVYVCLSACLLLLRRFYYKHTQSLCRVSTCILFKNIYMYICTQMYTLTYRQKEAHGEVWKQEMLLAWTKCFTPKIPSHLKGTGFVLSDNISITDYFCKATTLLHSFIHLFMLSLESVVWESLFLIQVGPTQLFSGCNIPMSKWGSTDMYITYSQKMHSPVIFPAEKNRK